jgi:ACS family tartrate transporter-like MFS transporter
MPPENLEKQDTHLKNALKKISIRLIPWVFVLYIIAFIDRSNMGFAIPGMESQLAISAAVAGLAGGIFFFGYFVFQIPGTYLVHKHGAKIMIFIFLLAWGIFAIINGLVQNATQLYIMRFLIGFAEGAFFPGVIYYLSIWFPSKQRAAAVAMFMAAIPVSQIIAGPISGEIVSLLGWRYVFFIEGIPAVIFAFLTFFYLTNRPIDARWLPREEKDALMSKLKKENEEIEKNRGKYKFTQAFKDPKSILLVIAYFFWMIELYAVSIWMPDILLLGEKKGIVNAGIGVGIIWFIGLIAMVIWGRHSDKKEERIHHTGIGFVIGLIGGIISMYSLDNFYLLAIGLTLLVIGILVPFGPFWAIPTKYLTAGAAAVTIGLINSIGNLGGFVGPYAIGYVKTATGNFILAYSLFAIFFAISVIAIYVLKFYDRKL